jgi:hypothetical protein
MNLPDWLISLLQQFPIVGVIVGVVWLVLKWVDRRLDGEIERHVKRAEEANSRADAEVQRVREDRQHADRQHDAQIERVSQMYEREIAILRKRVKSLEEQLDGRDS